MKGTREMLKIIEGIKAIGDDPKYIDNVKKKLDAEDTLTAQQQADHQAALKAIADAKDITQGHTDRAAQLDKREKDIKKAQDKRDAELDAKEAGIVKSKETHESLLKREADAKEALNDAKNGKLANEKEAARLQSLADNLKKQQDKLDAIRKGASSLATAAADATSN